MAATAGKPRPRAPRAPAATRKAAPASPAARTAKKAAKRPAKKVARRPDVAASRAKPVPKTSPGSRPKPVAKPAQPAAAPAGWLAVDEPEPQWLAVPSPPQPTPVARPTPAAPASSRAFHPATGDWLPVDEPATPASGKPQPAAPGAPPEAYRRGVGSTLLNILLGIDLALFAVGLLFSLATGAALLWAPDSELARRAQEGVTSATASGIALNTAINLVMFGVIPFIWVLGTRVKAHPGAQRYLQLRFQARDWLRGLALVPAMLVAVAVLSTLYILATEGPDGLTNGDAADNPAVQAILENLSWPLALFIALGAGIGEEIFFRGVLQRRLGVWGQGILFGLAHAAGGYVPQVLFAAGLGLVFGLLAKRGWSLLSLILAHFLYDFTLLALALAFPEFG